jgi:hypothetical protein
MVSVLLGVSGPATSIEEGICKPNAGEVEATQRGSNPLRKEDAQAADDFDADAFDRKLEEGEMEPKPFWPIVVAALVLIIAVASSIVSVARTLGWLGS